jgi:CelD/BcsL family acetyltransferase involved in cellulose biosynthesis
MLESAVRAEEMSNSSRIESPDFGHATSGGPAVKVDVIRDPDGLLALRNEWNDLVEAMRLPSPYQSWEWNRAWWQHFGAPGQLQVLVFRLDGSAIGIAPFYRRRDGGLSSLAPLGWENYEQRAGITELWEFVFPETHRLVLWQTLCTWLQAARWHAVLLPIRSTDTLPSWLVSREVKREMSHCFFRSLPSDAGTFVAELGKSMRSNARYYPRLLVREGHQARFRIATSPSDIANATHRMIDLHRSRAALDARTDPRQRHRDYFKSGVRRAFLTEVSVLLANKGEFSVGELEVDGELVAAQAWMEKGRTIFLQYSGFRMEWARYSVGMICTLEILKDAMGRGLDRVEFLRGPGQFKEKWDVQVRYEGHVLVARHPRMMKALLAIPPAWRHKLNRHLQPSMQFRRLS